MKYCKICLENNLRPNTVFNKKNICPSCIFYKKNLSANFENKFDILKKIIKKYSKYNSEYDCIIGVSGGKDSTRQALWVRDKLKMKPLLVCLAYPPEQVTNRGAENISNLINLGFSTIIISPAPEVWRNLLKQSFFKFANWAKSTELALFSAVPRIAINYKIPLIFWGENPGLQLGDLKSNSKNGWDGKNLKFLNTLNAGKINWINRGKLKVVDLYPYKYPSTNEFKKNKLKVIYLGWFWKDWSLIKNGMYSISNGLIKRNRNSKNEGDLYGITSLDEDWVLINQLIKYYKYGFGRATDYMNQEIRSNEISRKEAIKIVKKYDNKCSKKVIKSFCKYININEKKFWSIVKKNTNKKLFKINKNKITPKFFPGVDLNI